MAPGWCEHGSRPFDCSRTPAAQDCSPSAGATLAREKRSDRLLRSATRVGTAQHLPPQTATSKQSGAGAEDKTRESARRIFPLCAPERCNPHHTKNIIDVVIAAIILIVIIIVIIIWTTFEALWNIHIGCKLKEWDDDWEPETAANRYDPDPLPQSGQLQEGRLEAHRRPLGEPAGLRLDEDGMGPASSYATTKIATSGQSAADGRQALEGCACSRAQRTRTSRRDTRSRRKPTFNKGENTVVRPPSEIAAKIKTTGEDQGRRGRVHRHGQDRRRSGQSSAVG